MRIGPPECAGPDDQPVWFAGECERVLDCVSATTGKSKKASLKVKEELTPEVCQNLTLNSNSNLSQPRFSFCSILEPVGPKSGLY
jgi:hypothetical protein